MAGQGSTARRPRPTTTKCVAAALLAMVIVVAIIVILWLTVRPARPLAISVDHAAVTGFNFTSRGALNGTFDITLRAFNRNKRAAVSYQSLEVGVWYDGAYLAGTVLPGFDQPPKGQMRIDVDTPAARAALPPGVEATMKKDSSDGNLPVEVHVRAKVRFRYGMVKTRRYTVRASCTPVVIVFASPSSFDRLNCYVRI
ncbi:NDR1/HIN1-like protein 6 [Oryza brachyantha]|uniref:Late embryogenesis abundant protein LEA-2 subgroup domain-containing protein n=1 Tax=Oryza brachyantha TaxID=4533 RepID=J3LFM3_ORYBR|nr:NDR1/HIN1-like protein 6 [Oryza brachyantha]